MIWAFSVNALLFASGASVFPFLVLYYQSLGFTGTQIGLIVGLAPLVAMVAGPLWTNVADRTRRHRLVMSLLILSAAAALFAFPSVRGFVPVMAIAFAYNGLAAPVLSFSDNATMATLGGKKALYGRVRLGGTIGFGLAALLAGLLVENLGLRWAFWAGGGLQLLALAAAQPLSHRSTKAGEAASGRMTTLLTDPRWLPFLLITFSGGLALSVSNTYLFAFMQELGASEDVMGLALAVGTVAEMPVFFFGDRLLKRWAPFTLMLVGMFLTGARLLAFTFSTTAAFVLFLQLLGGLTFPVVWLSGVAYADENAPPGLSATAQGLFGAMVFGFGAAVGGFAGGPLLENLGGRGMFLAFGIVVVALVAGVALLYRRGLGREKARAGGDV